MANGDLPAGKYDVRVTNIVVDDEGNASVRMTTHGPGAGVTFMMPIHTVAQREAEIRRTRMDPLRAVCLGTIYSKFGSEVAERYVEEAEHQEGIEYWLRFVADNEAGDLGLYKRDELVEDVNKWLEALNET